MIRIVGKGYKYLLQQLSDFFGISKTIVISLKSVEGIKKYEKVFGGKLEDKKANPIIRVITSNQSFLTDFISNLFEKPMSFAIVSDYILTKNSNFKIIFQKNAKENKKEIKSGKRCVTSIFQTLLSDFFDDKINFLRRKIRIPYKIRPAVVGSKDYVENILPRNQIRAFQNLKKFNGYLGNIFSLNPSLDAYLNIIQVSIGYEPQLELSAFNNVFKLKIARCKLGYSNLESFIRDYNQNQALRKELIIKSEEKITLSSYRRNLKMIYPYLDKFTETLLQEIRNLNLIGDKIWIWDRRFFKCNCSGLKKKKQHEKLVSDDTDYIFVAHDNLELNFLYAMSCSKITLQK